MKDVKTIDLWLLSDSDKTVKIDGEEFECYSKKEMKKMYDDSDDYRIVGEIIKNNKKRVIGKVVSGDKEFGVSEKGSHNRILYYPAGFVKVGDDKYIQLLKFRAFIILFIGLLIGIIIAGIILAKALLGGDEIDPDIDKGPVIINPMPDKDPNLVPDDDPNGGGQTDDGAGEKTDIEEGGGSVSMIYTLEADLSLASSEIAMYFKNPSNSSHDVVLELYVMNGEEPIYVSTSGRIPAGTGLFTMTFDPSKASLAMGSYEAQYRVLYYDPNSGERALVESVIDDVILKVKQ